MSVELEKKWALPQVAFYLIKKFLLIFVAVNIEDNILQICIALYISEIYTIYILFVKPMDRRSRNLNEQFNEITIILLLIILSLLTDFVPASVRYQVGNFVMGMIYLQVFVNSVFLMVDVIGSLGRVYKILRFKYVMRERAKQVRTHNKTVDEIDKNRNSEQHLDYKKRVPITKPELEVIESVGSEPSSSLDSIVVNN
jgi:ABC-type multidrug transport system fused ATPase/permease subunit